MGDFPLSAVPTEEELSDIGFQFDVGLELVDGTVFATFKSRNGVNDLFVLAIRPARGDSFENTELDDLIVDLGKTIGSMHRNWREWFKSVKELQQTMLNEIIPDAIAHYKTLSGTIHRVIAENPADWLS